MCVYTHTYICTYIVAFILNATGSKSSTGITQLFYIFKTVLLRGFSALLFKLPEAFVLTVTLCNTWLVLSAVVLPCGLNVKNCLAGPWPGSGDRRQPHSVTCRTMIGMYAVANHSRPSK